MTDASYKNMRLLVLFDMPVEKADQRKEYARFRKKIMDDGFMMLQFSVYSRYCNNDSDAEKHIKRVKDMKPKYGNVRILKVTENQFESMVLVQGVKSEQEIIETDDQLTVI